MITTATLWVCGKCGAVSHLDGGNPPYWHSQVGCPIPSIRADEASTYTNHTWKQVVVVVPYA